MVFWASPVGGFLINLFASGAVGTATSVRERRQNARYLQALSKKLQEQGLAIPPSVLNAWFLKMDQAALETVSAGSPKGRFAAAEHLRLLTGPELSIDQADHAVAALAPILLKGNNEFSNRVRHSSVERKLDEGVAGQGFVMEEIIDEIRTAAKQSEVRGQEIQARTISAGFEVVPFDEGEPWDHEELGPFVRWRKQRWGDTEVDQPVTPFALNIKIRNSGTNPIFDVVVWIYYDSVEDLDGAIGYYQSEAHGVLSSQEAIDFEESPLWATGLDGPDFNDRINVRVAFTDTFGARWGRSGADLERLYPSVSSWMPVAFFESLAQVGGHPDVGPSEP